MVETHTLVKSAETRHTPKRSLKVSLKMGLPSALTYSFLGSALQTILQTPTPALQASGLNMLSTQDAKKPWYSGDQGEILIDEILTSCVEEEDLGAGRNGVLGLRKALEMERKSD